MCFLYTKFPDYGPSCQAILAKDVKNELEAALDTLAGKGKGAKGKAPRGPERRKMWEEIKALRREYGCLRRLACQL